MIRRAFLIAVMIQGAGTVLGFATVLAISHFLGATAQGVFAIMKNWTELASAVLLFGLPQGVVYVINRGWLSASAAGRASGIYAFAAMVPTLAATMMAYVVGYLPIDGVQTVLFVTAGVCGYLYHGLIRGIVLTRTDGLIFSGLTVMPTVGLALIIGLQYAAGLVDLPLAFVGNGAICAAAAYVALRPSLDGTLNYRPGWRRELLRQSGHSFLQAAIIAVQPLIVFAIVKNRTGGDTSVGIFSFALVALVALNALISLVAPILYNAWSKLDSAAAIGLLRGRVLALAFGAGSIAMLCLLVGAPWIARLGGPTMHGTVPIIRILALAAIPLIFTRFALPAFLAAGRGEHGTTAGVSRLAAALGLLIALLGLDWQPLIAAAVAWCGSEWFAAAVIARQVFAHHAKVDALPD